MATAPLVRTRTEEIVGSALKRLEDKFPGHQFSETDLSISRSTAAMLDRVQRDIASAAAQLAEEQQRIPARGGRHLRAPKPRWQAEHRRPTLAQKLREFETEQQSIDDARRKIVQPTDGQAGYRILEQLCAHVDEHMVTLSDAFTRIDRDCSWTLDRSEWTKFLDTVGCLVPGGLDGTLRPPTGAEIDASWSLLDSDGDGKISFEEFLGVLRTQQSELRKQRQPDQDQEREQQQLQDKREQQQGVVDPVAPDGVPTRSRHHCRRRLLCSSQVNEIQNSIASSAVSGTIWEPTKKITSALTRWLAENAELCGYLPPDVIHEMVRDCDAVVVREGQPLLRYGELVSGVVVVIKGSASAFLPVSQNLHALDAKAPVRASVVESNQSGTAAVDGRPDLLKGLRTVLATQAAAKRWLSRSRRPCSNAAVKSQVQAHSDASAHRPVGGRRGATLFSPGCAGDGAVSMYELKFGSGEMLGEQRAFHNVNAAAVKRHGMMTVSATIQATEDCLGIAIHKPEHIVQLRDAYMRSQEFKIGFLRSISHYKHCSEHSLARIARSLRRRTYTAGTTLVRQGERDNKVYFCVAGKLQVTQHAQASACPSEAAVDNTIAVLGAHSCFGDWAVLGAASPGDSLEQGGANTHRGRTATLQCLTECDLLEMDGYNFLRTVEPRVQAALRHKRQLVESGELSMSAATQAVDDHLRRTGAVSASTGTCNSSGYGAGLYGIIRMPRKGSAAAAVATGDIDGNSTGGELLVSDTAAQFFSTTRHCPVLPQKPSPPVTPPKAQELQSGGRRQRNGCLITEGLPRQRSHSEPNMTHVGYQGMLPPIKQGPGGRLILERAISSR